MSLASHFVFLVHSFSFFLSMSLCSATSHGHAAAVISLSHFVPSSRRSAGYTQKRLTENLKVPYYVGGQFSKEFTGVLLKNLEQTVEDDYISSLRNNCWKEKQQSRSHLFLTLSSPILSCGGDLLTRIFFLCLRRFLQRKACFTELAILETPIFTKEHRGLAHQAVPSSLRSRLPYTAEAALTKASSIRSETTHIAVTAYALHFTSQIHFLS